MSYTESRSLDSRSFQLTTNSDAAVHARLQGDSRFGQTRTSLLGQPELTGQAEVPRTESVKGSQMTLRVNGHVLVTFAAVADALVRMPGTDTTTRATGAGDLYGGAHAVLGARLAPINDSV
jgi:hypothetical protein